MNNCQEVNWHMHISIPSNQYGKYSNRSLMVFCNNCPFLGLKCCCLPAAVCYCLFLGVSGIVMQGRITYRHHDYFLLSLSVAGGSNKRRAKWPKNKQERKEKKRQQKRQRGGNQSARSKETSPVWPSRQSLACWLMREPDNFRNIKYWYLVTNLWEKHNVQHLSSSPYSSFLEN